MRKLYIADDGKEFSTEKECKEYEKKLNGKYYETLFRQGTLKDRVENFIKKYNDYCYNHGMYYNNPESWRVENADSLFGEWEYGVVYVRDDVVNLLIERIRELES